jgi:CoA:oxalate CoA-transferase
MLAGPVRALADLAQSDWAQHRGLIAEVAPGLPIPAAPWQSDGADVGVTGPVAAMGADNRAVLTEIGGYGAAEIDALIEIGVLRSAGAPGPG